MMEKLEPVLTSHYKKLDKWMKYVFLKNTFKTLDNRQSMTVTAERRETKQLSTASILAFCLDPI